MNGLLLAQPFRVLALQPGADPARNGYNWASVLAFLVVGGLFVLVALALGRLLRPHMPSHEKGSTYECGERPLGRAWFQFNPRFYLVALVFIVFEVEIAFMVPVSTVYRGWAQGVSGTDYAAAEQLRFQREKEAIARGGNVSLALQEAAANEKAELDRVRARPGDADRPAAWLAFLELFVFVAILAVGLAYVWAKGDLEWVRRLKRDAPVKTGADLVPRTAAAIPVPSPAPMAQEAAAAPPAA